MCLFEYMCHVGMCPWKPEQGIKSPGTGVKGVLRCPTWVLGIIIGYSRRAANAITHWASF